MQTATARALPAAVAAAVALAFADSSIVVLALPDLYFEFQASIEGIAWVITAYNVVVAAFAFVLLPFVRRVSAALLTRIGLAVFLAASIGCAVAPGMDGLIAARAVQGIGGALLLVGALPLLAGLSGSTARGAVTWTTAGALGAAVGPALGGLLTQVFDWRAIFIVQAPIAGIALLATVGSHLADVPAEPEVTRERPALAANVSLALVFGALVGALFLAVLMLIALWQLAPLEAAGVVSAVPAATLAARPLSARLTPRLSVVGGAVLLAAGLTALALLPRSSIAIAAVALAFCGAGLGLAVPVLTHAAISPQHGLARCGAWSIGSRHLGLVLALVLIAPLLAFELDRGAERATLAGVATVLDAPVPLTKKIPIALDLRAAFEEAQQGELPDLDGPFDEHGAQTDERVADLRDSLLGSIKDALTRSFRSAYGLSALFALLALAPVPLIRRLEVW
jgi:predicted MFS family arabinose efflux permease